MDTRVPPVPSVPADTEGLVARLLSYAHYALPDPPVYADVRLLAFVPHDDDDDGVDRISLLPDVLLSNIVSRLPVTDAASTAVLSRRWRGVWRSAPLILVDSHLLSVVTGVARVDAERVTSAVSRFLAAHPGPFRCVHLTSSYMEDFPDLLTRWLKTLAVKGIQELVLVNRPWPLDLVLPTTFFGMATLTRLYLGFWKFPDTAGLPRDTSFPHLREIGLCNVIMKNRDLDFILARSPVLETLCVKGNMYRMSLHLISSTLRCVQISVSLFEEISVANAPRLERLILSGVWTPDGVCPKLKIVHAPKLQVLGYLDAGNNVLEVGYNIIKAETRLSPDTVVPSVTILALEVHFRLRNDAKMIPSVLRCFPNVERLHIMSVKTDQASAKFNPKSWNNSCDIECIRSHIKVLVFRDFRGDKNEIAFLKFFLGRALALKEVVVLMADGSYTSVEEAHSKVRILGSIKRASKDSSMLITDCSDPDGGNVWRFKRGSDFSLGDPFANY